jgi:transposase-like protein
MSILRALKTTLNVEDHLNNNMIERLHGTITQRNKIMDGLDDMETAQTMMDELRIYYNFIRPTQH